MKTLAPEMPILLRGSSYYVCNASNFTTGTSLAPSSKPMQGADLAWLVADKLGLHGWHRIKTFRNYAAGWDFGRGAPMSEHAFSSMCEFLKTAKIPEGKTPSVFLTGAGNLELCWENHSGAEVQAEFGPTKIEYFNSRTGEEGEVPADRADRVSAFLTE